MKNAAPKAIAVSHVIDDVMRDDRGRFVGWVDLTVARFSIG